MKALKKYIVLSVALVLISGTYVHAQSLPTGRSAHRTIRHTTRPVSRRTTGRTRTTRLRPVRTRGRRTGSTGTLHKTARVTHRHHGFRPIGSHRVR